MKRSSRSKGLFSEQEVIDSEPESLDADDIKILKDAGFKSEDTKHMQYEERKNLLTAILESSKKSKIFADKSPNAYQFSTDKKKIVKARSPINKSCSRKLSLSKKNIDEDMKAQTSVKDISICVDTDCKGISKNEHAFSPVKPVLADKPEKNTSDLIDQGSKLDGKRRILKDHFILNPLDTLSSNRAQKSLCKPESNVRLNARKKKIDINKTVAPTIFEEEGEMSYDEHGDPIEEKDVEYASRSKKQIIVCAVKSKVNDPCIKKGEEKRNSQKFDLLGTLKRGEHFGEENLQHTPRKKICVDKNSNALLMHNMSINFAPDRDTLGGNLKLSLTDKRNDFVYCVNKSNENNYLLKSIGGSILSPKSSMKRAVQKVIETKCPLSISRNCIRKKVSNKAVALGTECLAESHSVHHEEATIQDQAPVCVEDYNEKDEDETQPIEYMSISPSPNNVSDDEIQFKDSMPSSRKHRNISEQPEEVLNPSPQGSPEVYQMDTDEEETQPYESPKKSPYLTQGVLKSPTVVPESQSVQSSPASVVMMGDSHDLDEDLHPGPKVNTRQDSVLHQKDVQHQSNLIRTYPKQIRTSSSPLWASLCIARNIENPDCLAKVFELVYDIYFRRLKRAQQNLKGKVTAWGKPVTTGAHVEGCLIAKNKKTNLTRNRKVNSITTATLAAVNDSDHTDPDSPSSKAGADERAFKESGMRTGDARKGFQMEKNTQPDKSRTAKKTSNVVEEDDIRMTFQSEDGEQSKSDNDDSDYKPPQKNSSRQLGNSKKISKKRKGDNRETASKTSLIKRQKKAVIVTKVDEYGNDAGSYNQSLTIPAKDLKLSQNILPEREARQDKEYASTPYIWLDDDPTTSSNTNSQPGELQMYTTLDESSNDKKHADLSEENSFDEDVAETKVNIPLATDVTSSQRLSPGFNSQSSNSLLDVNGDLYSTQIARHKKRGRARQLPAADIELVGFTNDEHATNASLQEKSERDFNSNQGCATEKRGLRKRIREKAEKDSPEDEEHKAEFNSLNLFQYSVNEINDNSKKRKEVKGYSKAKTNAKKPNLIVASDRHANREPLSQNNAQDSLHHDEGSPEREKNLTTKINKAIYPSSYKNPAPWKEIQNQPSGFNSVKEAAQPCPVCGEKFSMEILESHASSCGEDVKIIPDEITICVYCQCEFHIDHIKEHQIKCSKMTKAGTPKRLTRSLKAGTSQMLKVDKVTDSSNESELEELLIEK